MSLNTIHLKSSLLARLYKHSLIETNTTTIPQSQPLNDSGNNQKKIVVIVSHEAIAFLPDDEFNFLTTVLTACRLSIADIAMINNYHVDQTHLQNIIHSEAKHILLFGVEPLSIGLPINFPQFQVQQFNKRTYLHAPTLAQIEHDKKLKTKLWNALKALFEI